MAGVSGWIESKQKIISDVYEFLIALGLNKNKIWGSYFGGAELQGKVEIAFPDKSVTEEMISQFFPEDIEMKHILLDLGLPKAKIIPFKNEDGFYGIKASDMYGGARAHLYYELSEKPCSNECYPEHNEYCRRFLEIVVFVQSYLIKKKDNNNWKFMPLVTSGNKPIIVAGIGMERMGIILQNVEKVEDIDIYQIPLSNLSKKYSTLVKNEILLHLLLCALFLVSGGGIPRTKTNRNRELKELLRIILDKVISQSTNEGEIKDIIYSYLNEIAEYFKDEYPQLMDYVDKALDYILKQKKYEYYSKRHK